jgi:hypothetical protein
MCYEKLYIQGEMQGAVVPALPARLGSFRKLPDGQGKHHTANPGLERANGGNPAVSPGSMTTVGRGPQVCQR